jgi:xylulokinase
MYAIGYDIGSSFVKGAIIDVENGTVVASASYPDHEMTIHSPVAGWAEQDPATWWEAIVGINKILSTRSKVSLQEIRAIGISYQMHGLVVVDRNGVPLRPSIIWCDSRATEIGRAAFSRIGEKACLHDMLNSPGNFTASKLKWVKENEPALYAKVYKALLPGDYAALRMTGEFKTTISGLSEGILWNFPAHSVAERVLNEYQLRPDLLGEIVPTMGLQGYLTASAAQELGLKTGIPVSYRAGDQPNNAFSLNVLEPGEIAATAGTSGVVYAVSGTFNCDPASRINAFAHVNHTPEKPHVGILLCINGTGISNSWIRKLAGDSGLTYNTMNEIAATAPVGSKGLTVLPFGNGAERMLGDRDLGAVIEHLNFNIHSKPHVLRAVQEGVAFAFKYGIEIMQSIGIQPSVMRAGEANMFLSPVFCRTVASVAGVTIELYNTDGAQGAARAAAVGAGLVPSAKEAFRGLACLRRVEPDAKRDEYVHAYRTWRKSLDRILSAS